MMGHNPNYDLSEICYLMNYYDQAHFIKEFKQFSGYTPTKFFKRLPDLAD
jgi:AraC-like DNA-binding protein